MALLRLTATAFLFATIVVSVTAQPPPVNEDKWNGNLRRVLQYLWPALVGDGGAGSIYYSTVCRDAEGKPIPFPEVDVRAPSPGKVGLAAIREIFSNDGNVEVSRDQSGMIRITIGQRGRSVPQTAIGKPQHALLQTRIRSLKFDRAEQYTPHLALVRIRNSKEFFSAMETLKLGYPSTVINLGIDQPEKGVPHLPPILKDRTLEQALNAVAKTFGGILLYGACDEGLVDFDYVGTGDFDETMKPAAGRKKYGTPIRTGR